jgi:stage IV sporulation protein B
LQGFQNLPIFSTFASVTTAQLWHIKRAGAKQKEGQKMKKMATRIFAVLLLICTISTPAFATDYLIPGGQVIGLALQDNTVTVAAFDHSMEAGKKGGLQIGDEILSIDGHMIRSAADVKAALDHSKGQIQMCIRRRKSDKVLTIAPEITTQGPKLGVFLKEGITGIGTITWYDPDSGTFASLGHGVHNRDGKLLKMVSGTAYEAWVRNVQKGEKGDPGQLHGAVTDGKKLGNLEKNTDRGIFGTCAAIPSCPKLPVADACDVRAGQATILSTVNGRETQEYTIEILKLYPTDSPSGRNLLIKVTDPDLLEVTGGIVQGMSGSPIIQDGKLVGAVTHVLVNQPDTGYGIFIENMLQAAG